MALDQMGPLARSSEVQALQWGGGGGGGGVPGVSTMNKRRFLALTIWLDGGFIFF